MFQNQILTYAIINVGVYLHWILIHQQNIFTCAYVRCYKLISPRKGAMYVHQICDAAVQICLWCVCVLHSNSGQKNKHCTCSLLLESHYILHSPTLFLCFFSLLVFCRFRWNWWFALGCLLKCMLHQLTLTFFQRGICMDMPKDSKHVFAAWIQPTVMNPKPLITWVHHASHSQ